LDISSLTSINFDWSSLLDAASEAGAELAKKEIGNIAESTLNQIKDKWKQVDWSSAQNKYRNNLLDTVSSTKILGNPKTIDIEKIYTDCYVYDRPSAQTFFGDDIQSIQRGDQQLETAKNRQPALEIALTGRNLFILGRPGAGKTTFLQYLTISACKGRITKTPIFVSLKKWSDSGLVIESFIATQFDLCGFPRAEPFIRALLQKGSALILLDGLDEVNEDGGKRSQTIREIVDLSLKYRTCQVCLTCRTAATDYSFNRFDYVEVADFSEDQQLHFISQWYGENTKQFDRFIAGWNESNNLGIRELGKTPLLISMLCLAFDETLQFPTRQVDLYKEAIDALLRKWDSSRDIGRDTFYKNLSLSRREHLLEHIAANFYFNSQIVFRKQNIENYIFGFLSQLPDKEKAEKSDASLVLRQIEAQHGLIIERAKNIYSFSHLTIQEYFTASFLVQSQNEKLISQVIATALRDQKWREVVLYTVALMPNADSILQKMSRELQSLRGNDAGVIRFLAYCYCDTAVASNRYHSIDGIATRDIMESIENKAKSSSYPELTNAEIKKIDEHLGIIFSFLKAKDKKYDFGKAVSIFSAAKRIISEKSPIASKILGGYRARPEEFTAYLYACRLMIESLEVAVSSERNNHIKNIMSIENELIFEASGHIEQ